MGFITMFHQQLGNILFFSNDRTSKSKVVNRLSPGIRIHESQLSKGAMFFGTWLIDDLKMKAVSTVHDESGVLKDVSTFDSIG